MSDCNSCKKGLHEKDCHDTPKLIQINNNVPTLMRRVEIPASVADDRVTPPVNGQYRNTLLVYEATGNAYLFSSDGIYTKVLTDGAIDEEVKAREDADKEIWEEIETIEASSDVVDVVGTYAELQQYDTSKLHDKDLIKVLQDETHDDAITYYRWSTSTHAFSYVGAEGPYYTVSETDTLLANKQDTLTAGENITITNNTISAADTTYTAGANVQISADNEISATDTTYSNFVGTDGQTAGTAGLVPAPATTDEGKFLKADGTWDDAGSPINVVQTVGTSTTDVMSQDAATKMVYASSNKYRVRIGSGGNADGQYSISIGQVAESGMNDSIAIGLGAHANKPSSSSRNTSGIAIGVYASASGNAAIAIGGCDGSRNSSYASGNGSVAIGAGAQTSTNGVFVIGTIDTQFGYNYSNYRLLTGVYDPQSAHDAATKGYVDSKATSGAGAPTTATVGTVGQLYQDTTNGKLYICTAVSGSVYTWSEVGGVPVVQTTGQSTTSVMSQKAVTDIIGDVESALQILNSGAGVP